MAIVNILHTKCENILPLSYERMKIFGLHKRVFKQYQKEYYIQYCAFNQKLIKIYEIEIFNYTALWDLVAPNSRVNHNLRVTFV